MVSKTVRSWIHITFRTDACLNSALLAYQYRYFVFDMQRYISMFEKKTFSTV